MRGYISAAAAKRDYALSDADIEQIEQALAKGESI
jgi:hypothetical protein